MDFLAWRLFSTLEGTVLVITITALVIYKIIRKLICTEQEIIIKRVIMTNQPRDIKDKLIVNLQNKGCVVNISENGQVCNKETNNNINEENTNKYDALIIIGVDSKSNDLDGLADVVSEEIDNNLKILETLAPLLIANGRIIWLAREPANGSFKGAGAAFNNVIKGQLQTVAKRHACRVIWIDTNQKDRGKEADLITCTLFPNRTSNFRTFASKVMGYLDHSLRNLADFV